MEWYIIGHDYNYSIILLWYFQGGFYGPIAEPLPPLLKSLMCLCNPPASTGHRSSYDIIRKEYKLTTFKPNERNRKKKRTNLLVWTLQVQREKQITVNQPDTENGYWILLTKQMALPKEGKGEAGEITQSEKGTREIVESQEIFCCTGHNSTLY